MQLTILGPAFGLPSIDSQCNAAVALLKLWASKTSQSWHIVVATTDFANLPRLQLSDGGRLYGYRAIAQHLALDTASLSSDIALTSFVESEAQLMIDVYHYVSYENYAGRTRSTFTKILPWYTNYILPPERRRAARKRTNHLGISGIDMDDVHESVIDRPSEAAAAERRFDDDVEKRAKSLLNRQRTLKSLLREPSRAGAFRLKSLADSFYEPLDAALGERAYFGSDDGPDATDCIVWSYLSLLLAPDMPQSWAADILRSQYPKLVEYTGRVSAALSLSVSSDHEGRETSLPWLERRRTGVLPAFYQFGQALVSQIPVWPELSPIVEDDKANRTWTSLDRFLPHTLASFAGTVVLSSYLLYRNGIWPTGQEVQIFGRPRLASNLFDGSAMSVLGALSA